MVVGVIAGLLTAGILSCLGWVIRSGAFGIRLWILTMWRPRADVRVSVSSLICVERDGQVLVKESVARPGTLEPFGGVRHVLDGGIDDLRARGFRAQRVGPAAGHQDHLDLRGFLKARHIGWLRRSAAHSDFIEPPTDTARRELAEELLELGCPIEVPQQLSLRVLRSFEQGPWSANSYTGMIQYRHFFVASLRVSHSPTQQFVEGLFDWAATSDKCVAVTPSEIERGRSSTCKREIANHAELLFECAIHRPDRPGAVEK